MEDLKNQFIEKLGISHEQADGAIAMVLNFVKDKLPESMHGMVGGLLGGLGGAQAAEGGEAEADSGGGMGDLLGKAKDLLGGFMK
jgi:hypothetical protein